VADTTTVDQAFALVLGLSPRERLQLVERIVASVEREMTHSAPGEETAPAHWGKHLAELVESLDLTDWTTNDTEDSVEWVKRIRQEQAARRGLDWGSDE
jgi:hypothetical protein